MILIHERRLGNAVSIDVLDKPKLSAWMILIPIFFIFFVYRFKRYKAGREEFVSHFLVTRERALDVAADAVVSGHKPDIEAIIQKSSSPRETLDDYRRWVAALVEHYVDLLAADGDNCDILIRRAYRKRSNYLLFVNQIGKLEKRFDAALKPHLEEVAEGVNDIVARMEQATEKYRRQFADEIFA